MVSGFRCSTFSLAGGCQIRVSLPVDFVALPVSLRVSLPVDLVALPVSLPVDFVATSVGRGGLRQLG